MRLGQPFQVTVRTTPYTTHERLVADLGVYVQDTWTIKRMTVNAGLRWDYLNNKVGAQDAPGGTWIGPRHFDELTDVPNFNDLVAAPRRRLRPVRQRQDGAEGDAQPLRADLDGRLRAAAQPAQHVGQQCDASVERCQRRRHPAGVGARRARQQRLRPGEHRHPVRSRNHRRLRQPAQQLGGVGDRVARADVAGRRWSCRTSAARRATSRPPTTSTSRRPTSSRTA